MINLALSLVAATLVWLFFSGLLLDSIWAGALPFVLVAVGGYFWLARRTSKKLEAIVLVAQDIMAKTQNARSQKQRELSLDRAVEQLKKGFALQHWQFFVGGQLNAQIGQILYIQRKYKEARPFLEKSYIRAWTSLAMLGCVHYRRKDVDAMKKAFEKAVKYNSKESLLWNLYGWCLWKRGEKDSAIGALNRGKEILSSDERLASNLDALRNNKKMKMRGWRELWYQFGLETPPQPKQRMDKRSMFRGR